MPYTCCCVQKCRGVSRRVTKRVYEQHAIFRQQETGFLQEGGGGDASTAAGNDHARTQNTVHTCLLPHRFPNKICVIVQSQLTQEPPVLAEAEAQVPDGDISLAAGPILTAHLPEGPQPHLEIDEPLACAIQDIDDSDHPLEPPEQANPGCLDEDLPPINNNTGDYEHELNDIFEAAVLDDLRVSIQFIQGLQTASLDDKYNKMDLKSVLRLRNPPQHAYDIQSRPDLRLGLEIFLVSTRSSVETYNTTREAILRRHPEDQLPSYDQMKKIVSEITGVTSVVHAMCKNSCMAFTGPFSDLDRCPKCNEPKNCPLTKKPVQEFHTMLLGPILQAMWREPSSAKRFQYRQTVTRTAISELQANGGILSSYDNFFYGADYLENVRTGQIKDNDIVLMLSMDGAQLYAHKRRTAGYIFG